MIGSITNFSNKIYQLNYGSERWFGAAASASGEAHVADRTTGNISPFGFTAGNKTFGSWLQIFGSSDTPVLSSNSKFIVHRFLPIDANSFFPYVIQISSGESSELSDNIDNDLYIESIYHSPNSLNYAGMLLNRSFLINAGTKVWARISCETQNAKTLNTYFSIIEFPN